MFKRIIGILLSLVMMVGCISFSAIAVSVTQEEKADELNRLGLFNGTGNGYELDGKVTRAQAVTMVLRYVGIMTLEYNSAAAVFDDVSENHWADGYIGKAVKLGIAKGTSEKTFEPEKSVSANEFVTFMLRAIGYTDANLENCIELALKYGVIKSDTISTTATEFNRGNMVEICWQTLDAIRADGVIVKVFFVGKPKLTLQNVIELSAKGEALSWEDFNGFNGGNDIGSGLYVLSYPIDETYSLMIGGGSLDAPPMYIYLVNSLTNDSIDIRTGNVEEFIEKNALIFDEFKLDMSMLQMIGESPDGKDKNFMFSPFSIKMAFMMAANGAEGETKNEILNALGINDLNEYNDIAKKTIETVNKNENFNLNIANSIWFNTDYYKTQSVKFADTYRKTVNNYYNAEAREVNKSNAVKTINDWISEKTNDRIKDVISDPDFLAALVNTIYFKADWAHPFTKEATVKADFTDKAKTIKQTDFMQQTANFEYFENDRMQMLNMPYKGSDISMYVFLPKSDTEITANDISFAIRSKDLQEVYVKMPKFKTEFSITLNNIMIELGIKKAFDDNCMDFRDVMFSGIPAGDSAYFDLVLHKSFIEVDEEGTEAAAATVIIMKAGSAMPQPKPEPKRFIADKTFIYMIRNNSSGEVLFMGQYAYVE